jgi:hypothetical protein
MRLSIKVFYLGAAALAGTFMLAGCAKDEAVKPFSDSPIEERGLTAPSANVALVGLTPNNELVNLMSGPPAVDMGVVPITGLRDQEFILAIDKRQRTNEHYGVSNQNILYRINVATGAATAVSGTPFNPAISGSLVGADFNPMDDLLRIISNTGQILKVSPMTGAVTGVEAQLGLGSQTINSVAYTPAANTIARPLLFELDINGNALYRLNNFGALQLVGLTGFGWSGEGGFEITSTYLGFAVQYGSSRGPSIGTDDTSQPAYRLYRMNLGTGRATSHGKVRPMIGLAVR